MSHDPPSASAALLVKSFQLILDSLNSRLILQAIVRRINNSLLDASVCPDQSTDHTMRVLARCCWGIKELLGIFEEAQQPYMRHAANALCETFVLVQSYNESSFRESGVNNPLMPLVLNISQSRIALLLAWPSLTQRYFVMCCKGSPVTRK